MDYKIKLILKEETDKNSESSNQEDESYKEKEKLLRFLVKKKLINEKYIDKVNNLLFNLYFGEADEQTDNNKEMFLLFNRYLHREVNSLSVGDAISIRRREDDPNSLFNMSDDEEKIIQLIYFLTDKGIFKDNEDASQLILKSGKKYNSLLQYYKKTEK